MKTVLCYGDSNTRGCVPKTLARFPRCVRWTGVMAETLGAEYEAVEDGIGYALLRAKPIDLVVVMLGTNDLIFTDEEGYGHGISLLTERILHADLFCQGSSSIFCGLPRLLLVSPILMGEDMSYHRVSCFRKNLGAVHGQMPLDVVENGTEE